MDIIGAVAPKREAEWKWTPGPWQWGYRFEEDLTRWALRSSGNPLAISGRTHRAIANRALIAAAPDLYEALEATRKHLALFCRDTDSIAKAVFDMADAALRKARGETP